MAQFGVNFTHAFNRDDDSNELDFNRQTALNTYNLKLDSAWSKNDIRRLGRQHRVGPHSFSGADYFGGARQAQVGIRFVF